jgi:3'(2'), 5'-bisphosphate nucleotidase
MTSPPEATTSHNNTLVSLLDLAAATLSSAIVAADQIKSLAAKQDDNQTLSEKIEKKNVRLKNDGSYVTDADLAAQQIIVDGIQNVSTAVRIVGEESEEEMKNHAITGHEERCHAMFRLCRQEIGIRYDRSNEPLPLAQQGSYKLNGHGISAKTHPANSNQEEEEEEETVISSSIVSSGASEWLQDRMEIYEVDPRRVSVFIDPLDGTKAYAKGDYDPVSILIAIILDQTPCFGVICKPFGYVGQTSILDTGCVVIYGGTLLGGAFTAGGSGVTLLSSPRQSDLSETTPCDITTTTPTNASTSFESPRGIIQNDLPRAVISSSRSQGIVEDFVTHLGDKGMINPQPLLISGAGEKSLRIILRSENEGLWFFPKAGTSLWDVAASDALLRATGGRLTDKHGNDMDYSKSRTEAENEDGVVACYDQRLHAECIRLFLEGSWQKSSSSPS